MVAKTGRVAMVSNNKRPLCAVDGLFLLIGLSRVKDLEENLRDASDDKELLKCAKRTHGLIIEYLDDGLDAIKRIVKELNTLLRRYERQERGKK